MLNLEVPDGCYAFDSDILMVAEEAERRLPLEGTLLDLGCGVGTIAIRIAQLNPLASITGVDVSGDAVLAAKKNAVRNGAAHATFMQSDVYDNVHGTFDVITCTLPWESEENYDTEPSPRRAYICEDMGLARALHGAREHLRPGGYFVMWGPANIGRQVFPMVGLTPERYVFDSEENCVVVGHA